MKTLLAIILGYLLGSLSAGIIVMRVFGHKDIRTMGSGNPGTTNILRVMGKKYALLTFLIDFFKGVLAAWLGFKLTGTQTGGLLGGIASVIGHNYPLYFGFKGGKGIATSFGALLYLFPLQTTAAFLSFLIVVAVTRYVSAGSVTAAVVLPLGVILTPSAGIFAKVLVTAFGLLAIYRHRQNIVRLMEHRENKISFNSKK